MGMGAYHHPNRKGHPSWVILMKNHLFHKVVTMIQRMNPTIENLMYIRNFIDALEYEYLRKKCIRDVEDGIGADSNAVKKALKEQGDALQNSD